MEVVGTIHVVAAGVPRVEVDAAQVDHPQQACQVLDDREIDDVPRGVLDGACANPRGARGGRALHEEKFTRRAARVPLHHHRSILEVRQQVRRDVSVILQ